MQRLSFLYYIDFYLILIWHISMLFNAFSWLSGVTPAQQLLSTVISSSGKYALMSRALEITHISVQSPTISTSRRPFNRQRYFASSIEPKVGLSKTSSASVASCSWSCQPHMCLLRSEQLASFCPLVFQGSFCCAYRGWKRRVNYSCDILRFWL